MECLSLSLEFVSACEMPLKWMKEGQGEHKWETEREIEKRVHVSEGNNGTELSLMRNLWIMFVFALSIQI